MKRFLSMLLVIVMAFCCFAGCGDKEDVNTDPNGKYSPGNDPATFTVANAIEPIREFSNKKVTYYCWQDMETLYDGSFNVPKILKDEFGIELTPVYGTHESYWDTLATMIASNTSPDIVYLKSNSFYPIPIIEEYIQPLDDYIDFSDPMWADTAELRENYKWKGKTYVPVYSENVNSLLFYNKSIFKNFGVKTPDQYYAEDNWTWDTLVEIADKFLVKKGSNVSMYGLGIQESYFTACIGKPLIEGNDSGATLNINDTKLAKVMNSIYKMGQGGSGTLAGSNAKDLFASGKCAMMMMRAGAATGEYHEMLKAGKLGFICMPKVDKDSKYYLETTVTPGWAMVSGAKNPDAAAFIIEWCKWLKLGEPAITSVTPEQNAAMKKYASTFDAKYDPNRLAACYTENEQAWGKVLSQMDTVSNDWCSWIGGTLVLEGYHYIWGGTKQWSAVLEEVEPSYKSLLNSFF